MHPLPQPDTIDLQWRVAHGDYQEHVHYFHLASKAIAGFYSKSMGLDVGDIMATMNIHLSRKK